MLRNTLFAVALFTSLAGCQTRSYNSDSEENGLFGGGGYQPWELKLANHGERPKNERKDWQPLQCKGDKVEIIDADPSYTSLIRLVIHSSEGDYFIPLSGSALWMAEPGRNGGGTGNFDVSPEQVGEGRVTRYARPADVDREMKQFAAWVDKKGGVLTPYEGFVVRNRYRQLSDLLEGFKAQRAFYAQTAGKPMAKLEARAVYHPASNFYDMGGSFNVTISAGPAELVNQMFTLTCTNALIKQRKEKILNMAVSKAPGVIEQLLAFSNAQDKAGMQAAWKDLKKTGEEMGREIKDANGL